MRGISPGSAPIFLACVALVIAACEPEREPPADCDAVRGDAYETAENIRSQYSTCASVADCTTVELREECFATCPVPVRVGETEAFKKAVSDNLDCTVGCTAPVPSCSANALACTDNRCTDVPP